MNKIKNFNQYFSQSKSFLTFLKSYVFAAMLSMYITLFVPMIGEEGTYTINAMELWHSKLFWNNTFGGLFYPRPPLFKILIALVAHIIGWRHVLIASRFVTATSIICLGFVLYWLIKNLTKEKIFAWLVVAIYFTGDLLFRRGWLSYSDPLLSFFIFTSMACLWIAVERKNFWLLGLAVVSLLCGFLTKTLTVYMFYGVLAFWLLIFHRNRSFLLHPISWILHLFALSFPFLWAHLTTPLYLTGMWHDLFWTQPITEGAYLYNVFLYQPVMLFVHFLPLSIPAFYYYIRRRHFELTCDYSSIAKIAFLTFTLSFLPCWFARGQWPEARYYMPVYPMMAISMAYIVWNAPIQLKRLIVFLLAATLILKFLACIYFYAYQIEFYGDDQKAARDIIQTVQDYPLYTDSDLVAPALSITSVLDSIRWPKTPLIVPDIVNQKPKTYYVIGLHIENNGHLVKMYPISGSPIYLSCYGDCEKEKR